MLRTCGVRWAPSIAAPTTTAPSLVQGSDATGVRYITVGVGGELGRKKKPKRLRSQEWFDIKDRPSMTALYLERYLNYGLTREELQSGRPIIGIAQTGSDLSPCNRHHVALASRVKDGIRDAGGLPLEFPCHPIQETGRRPTAGLDRNLSYLSLVEVLHGYPLDGVVLTTGCDKTTPAALMAAGTTNLPSIVLSGGPMLDGHYKGELVGSGTVVWRARKLLAAGKIDDSEFIDMVAASAPSAGHCNTMGTATSMNSLAEALGMSLGGSAVIPAPYRERGQVAYLTGKRAVELVREDVKPSDIMTRGAFENAIAVASAIGASSNCPPHVIAIARHVGVELSLADWQELGADVPLLANIMPAGEHLGESFHRAGGVPAIMKQLLDAGRLNGGELTVSGRTIAEQVESAEIVDPDVIWDYNSPIKTNAGFLVLSGNLFESAIMKVSGVSKDFRKRFLEQPDSEGVFVSRVIVFEGPEDYHERINDPELDVDESCMLVVRGCGPIGYPGSSEVVNMAPPKELIDEGVSLPTMGDGRQSGTSGAPSILNASPEAAVGGGLAILRSGDLVKVDLNERTVNVMISDEELEERWNEYTPPELTHQTPWQELSRTLVGQLETGACMDFALPYFDCVAKRGLPRHSH